MYITLDHIDFGKSVAHDFVDFSDNYAPIFLKFSTGNFQEFRNIIFNVSRHIIPLL